MAKPLDEAVGTALLKELEALPESGLSRDTRKELADKYGVSEYTVQKLRKKALSEKNFSELSAADQIFLQSQHITMPRRLQGKIEEVEYLKRYLEDRDEGWRYTRAKGSVLTEGKARAWSGIVYADTPEEAQELMDQLLPTGLQYAWAFHNLDYWPKDSKEEYDEETGVLLFAEGEKHKAGDLKKPHIHVIVLYDRMTAWEDVQALMSQIFGIRTVVWQKVGNLAGAWAYLIHDTQSARAAAKYQYPREIRHAESGFHVKLSDYDKNCITEEITRFITHDLFEKTGRYELKDVALEYEGQLDVLGVMRGSANYFNGLLMSCRKVTTEDDIRRWCKKHRKAVTQYEFYFGLSKAKDEVDRYGK